MSTTRIATPAAAAAPSSCSMSAPTRRAARPRTRPVRRRAQPLDRGVDRDEELVGIRGRQVREGLRDRLAGLARRDDRGERQARVRVDAGAATRRRRSRCRRARSRESAAGAHPAAFASRLPRPMLDQRSPSARRVRHGVERGTSICSWMISTPTWLSVEGPVTTHGSMPKRSRSSFTPPQAATGSFADSTIAGERAADVGALEDRIDAVGAEDAVAELEHDDVGLAGGELGEHGARERRPVRAGRRARCRGR